MDAKRYTQSQVLCGLREAWAVATGTDDPFDAETQIYPFMLADGSWDDLDLADIFFRLEQFFEFTCGLEEWKDFFSFDIANRSREEWEQIVAPKLTFGSLAEFIAQRAPMIASFVPIPVFGRNCATAGVFVGIQRVADNVKGNCRQFAPSARIIDVMRGNDLDNFWTQLRWMIEDAAPKLPACWRDVTSLAGCLAVLGIIGGLIAAWATSDPVWIGPTLVGAVAVYLVASFYKLLKNPLPPHIVSFRDLSILIAESRKSV